MESKVERGKFKVGRARGMPGVKTADPSVIKECGPTTTIKQCGGVSTAAT
jgi:hypothetical protein